MNCESLKRDISIRGNISHYQQICIEKIRVALKELVDKETPKKLKRKTDKDGRILWVCPTCGDVYKKFWSEVETVTHRKHCDNCGQKLDWSEEE